MIEARLATRIKTSCIAEETTKIQLRFGHEHLLSLLVRIEIGGEPNGGEQSLGKN